MHAAIHDWTILCVGQVSCDGESARLSGSGAAGLLHPGAERVIAGPVRARPERVASFEKVQVKYAIAPCACARRADSDSSGTGARHSRAAFYLVAAAFKRSGISGCWTSGPGGAGR